MDIFQGTKSSTRKNHAGFDLRRENMDEIVLYTGPGI
jgi:hypothetical protein